MNARRLFCVGLIAVVAGSAAPAWSYELTLDVTQAAHAVAELAQLQQQYTVLMKSYMQLQSTVASLRHLSPNIMGIAPGLQADQMRLPGSDTSALPGMNFGSNLSGAGQQFYNQNHVYTPQGNDFAATELQRRQIATANLQGEAATGMRQIAARIASLAQLESSIQTQPDVMAAAAITARINAEHLYLTNESNNISHLQLLMATQEHVDQQRGEQFGRMQEEQAAAAAGALAGWGQ
jgi:hypothetical protein